MRYVGAPLAAALLVFAPAQAHARPLDEFVSFAQSYWHTPCVIGATYRVDPDPRLENELGAADPASCSFAVAPGLTDAETCAVVMHEVGHLSGAVHSKDVHSIMYRSVLHLPVCERAYGSPASWLAGVRRIVPLGWLCRYQRSDSYAAAFLCHTKSGARARAVLNFYWESSFDATLRRRRHAERVWSSAHA